MKWGNDVGSRTFPGGGWYTPVIGGTGTHGTLPMTDEEKAEAAEREARRRPIGFAPPVLELTDKSEEGKETE